MTAVRLLTTGEASDDLLAQIRGLLEEAFAGHFSDEDWDNALGGWHAVVTEADGVVAHAAVVPRTLEVAGRPLRTGYVEAVATMAARRSGAAAAAAPARSGPAAPAPQRTRSWLTRW